MASRFSVDAVFRAVDRFTGPLRSMGRQMVTFSALTTRSMEGASARAATFMTGVHRGVVAIGVAGAATAAIIGNIVSVGATYERTLVTATAKFPGHIQRGTAAFEALDAAAQRAGATTEFDATGAAGALQNLAQAGFNAEQAIASLPGVVDLATNSGLELAEATGIATNSLGAYNLMTSDAAQLSANLTRVNDVFARTTTTANTSVTEMFEALTAGGPVANAAGASLETFSSLVGAMASAGIKGAEAGTALRNTFTMLQAPAAAGARALRQLRVETTDSSGNMRDVIDIIGDLTTATAGMGTAQRAQHLNAIFGARGIASATILMNAGSDSLRAFRTNLEGANGASAAMAATMRDTTTGDLDGLSSAVDGVKIAIFSLTSGALRDVINKMADWTNANSSVIASGVQEFVSFLVRNLDTFVEVVTRVGRVVAFFYAFAAAVRIAAAAQAAFNFVAAANPYVLVAMAIVAAIALLVAYWPEVSAFFGRLYAKVKPLLPVLVKPFVALWSVLKSVGKAIAAFFVRIWPPLKAFLVGSFEFVVGALLFLTTPIRTVFSAIMTLARAAATWVMAHWTPISEFFAGIAARVTTHFSLLWANLTSGASTAGAWIRTNFGGVWDWILEKVRFVADQTRFIWEPIGAFFSGLFAGIADAFTGAMGWIIDALGGIVESTREAGRAAIEGGPGGREGPQVVTPATRAASTTSETHSTTTTQNEVTVRAAPGTTATNTSRRGSPPLRVQPSGR